MTTPANPSPTAPAAAPAAAPSQVPPLQWSYPFPDGGRKEILDPHAFYEAFGAMDDGFFPLGVNGFPHGGVHFGQGTASRLYQGDGVRCIADGEIVAYRVDDGYPHLFFTQSQRWAMYSTGFVLVRHRMALPPAPGSTVAAQPADEILEFYSLYMHMADWNTYLTDGHLNAPGWWLGVQAYRIQGVDHQIGGGATGAFAWTAPKAGKHGRFAAGQQVGFLPEGSEVTIGERRGEWGHINEVRAGAMISPTSGGDFGSDDLNMPWQRPDSDTAGHAPVTPQGDWGWIRLHDHRPITEPAPLGSVVIPPQPIRVKAGTLLGQIGEYHDYGRSTPLPPKPARQLLHLEVFAGEQFGAFLAKSRARAAQLPADQRKAILTIQAGAKLVREVATPDVTVPQITATFQIEATPDSPKTGPWVRVRPKQKQDVPQVNHGNPVWIERKYLQGSPGAVSGWKDFPLQLQKAAGPANSDAVAYSRVQLDAMDGAFRTTDDHGVHWWQVSIGTTDGSQSSGWVCEQTHPGTQWDSPWAWPGFSVVDATGINLSDAFRRNLVLTGSANLSEQQEFEPSAQAVNGSALLLHLEKTVSRLSSGEHSSANAASGSVVTAGKLQQAMRERWLASELSHVILRYESEWGGDMSRWEALTPLMKNAQENWKCELQRIKKLQWWSDVKGKVAGFPGTATVYHIHPIALVGNYVTARATSISENGIYFIFKQEALAGVTNKLHWPGGASGVTLGAGYDMKARSAESIAQDMKSIGIDEATARAISSAATLTGQEAKAFCKRNATLVDLTDDKQLELLRKTVVHYEQMVRDAVKVGLQQHQFDALVSYAYNPGGGWGSVTSFVNAGETDQAMNKIKQYVISGGEVYDGLVKRRADEVTLYATGRYEFHSQPLSPR
ncbi:glycoside hydrolase family protein [Trinickia fusca]|uniref:Lysozyme n=1 Tax=Trinickia fusca TaxID=2419777 RepID=A0A494X8T0_9BURK|nr:glycoside hydrolase family protein [Trinickia fusca]RKP46978.1 lytic transglycosylase domain-containing protein [Trinickia fusca]